MPDLVTVRDRIAWSYANLACAHAALSAGRTKHARTDWMVRAKLFRGLRMGTMKMGSLYADERLKLTEAVVCTYCGGGGPLTIDHLIPRAVGGSDDGDNLVRACRPCNSSKSKRDLMCWYEGRNSFPGLLLLRRYLKLAAAHCERLNLLDADLTDPRLRDLPIDIQGVPIVFPELAQLRM